jgi:hypothetical protein
VVGGLALNARARGIAALALLAWIGPTVGVAEGRHSAVGWRGEVGARIEAGWAAHGEAYQRIVHSAVGEDRRGGVVLPALAEAERVGVDTVPLIYQLLLDASGADRVPEDREARPPATRSGDWIRALGRELRAIAAVDAGRVDQALLAAWTLDEKVPPEVRIEVAWSLAAAAGAGDRTIDRTLADLDRLRVLLAAEAGRSAPSGGVVMALLDGLIAVARRAGPVRSEVVRELQALGPELGLSAERIVHALGEIGGTAAEAAVLSYLDTSTAETERGWALGVLPRIGGDRALMRAFGVASDPATSSYLREAAIAALGRFGFDSAIADGLEAISRDASRSIPERLSALAAFREMLWGVPSDSAQLSALVERLGRLERLPRLVDAGAPR